MRTIAGKRRGAKPPPTRKRTKPRKTQRPSREDLEKEAYFRWERRGCYHGGDMEDWLAAEEELGAGGEQE